MKISAVFAALLCVGTMACGADPDAGDRSAGGIALEPASTDAVPPSTDAVPPSTSGPEPLPQPESLPEPSVADVLAAILARNPNLEPGNEVVTQVLDAAHNVRVLGASITLADELLDGTLGRTAEPYEYRAWGKIVRRGADYSLCVAVLESADLQCGLEIPVSLSADVEVEEILREQTEPVKEQSDPRVLATPTMAVEGVSPAPDGSVSVLRIEPGASVDYAGPSLGRTSMGDPDCRSTELAALTRLLLGSDARNRVTISDGGPRRGLELGLTFLPMQESLDAVAERVGCSLETLMVLGVRE